MPKSLTTIHQPSLTEWFHAIGNEADSKAIREEDNSRTERFITLYETFGFPYDRPEVLPAIELAQQSPAFKKVFDKWADLPSAIRLVPTKPGLPKLRDRRQILRNCYEKWFLRQQINYGDYLAEIYRHHEIKEWSTTFIVTKDGIFGEIIRGSASQLTQGETLNPIYQFNYNFSNWLWAEENTEAQKMMKKIIALVYVPEINKQKILKNKMNVACFNNYVSGYFEATTLPDGTIFFIDYNRIMPKYIPKIMISKNKATNDELKGMVVSPGKAIGKVVIANEENLGEVKFDDGDILVCDVTDVRYLPLMRKAGAIVTGRGGVLSHAAIVARELKKPCIVGVSHALSVLKDGNMIEVDAKQNLINII